MRWSWCGCEVRFLVRLDRRLWMRLVPGRRHYYCARCKAHQFLSRHCVRAALPARDDLHSAHTTQAPLQ